MRNHIHKIAFIFCSLLGFLSLEAQEADQKDLTVDDIVFKKEFSIGLKMHTNGFGLGTNIVRIKNIRKKTVYQIGVMNLKHPKEFRQQSIYASGRNTARGFIYGKQNSFYNLNFTLGQVRSLAEKGRKSGVGISLYYGGGVSLGIQKPYYLELIYGSVQGYLLTEDERYSSENASFFLNEEVIYGASGFSHGWGEITPVPGGQAKLALLFDWATYNEFVKALEVGVMVNAYYKRVPILVTDDNHFLFANLYIRLILGKRWY